MMRPRDIDLAELDDLIGALKRNLKLLGAAVRDAQNAQAGAARAREVAEIALHKGASELKRLQLLREFRHAEAAVH